MTEAAKTATDKLATLKDVSQDLEIKQLASIMMTYIRANEKQPEAGFAPPNKEKNNEQ